MTRALIPRTREIAAANIAFKNRRENIEYFEMPMPSPKSRYGMMFVRLMVNRHLRPAWVKRICLPAISFMESGFFRIQQNRCTGEIDITLLN